MVASLRDRPAFICGHPKSGTSLLRNLLDSHPELIVYPEETVFFRRFLPHSEGLAETERIALAEETLLHIFTWNTNNPPKSQRGLPDRDYSAISFEQIREAFRRNIEQHGVRHPGDWLGAAVLAYGEVVGQIFEGTQRWVEKSPYNEQFASAILSLWPEARCIHILRDPRDNHLSYRRKHPDWGPEFFAENWKKSTRAGLQNRESFGENRYLILKYEDLVQLPQEILKQVCTFLGVAFDEALQTPTRAGRPWGGNSMFAEQFRAIDASPVGRWKSRLPAQEAAVIEWIAGEEMKETGYSGGEPLPFAARVRGASWPIRQKINALRNKVGL